MKTHKKQRKTAKNAHKNVNNSTQKWVDRVGEV